MSKSENILDVDSVKFRNTDHVEGKKTLNHLGTILAFCPFNSSSCKDIEEPLPLCAVIAVKTLVPDMLLSSRHRTLMYGLHLGPSSNSRTSNVINLRILMGFKTWILQHCKISIYFSGVWLICGRRRSSCYWLNKKDVVFQCKSLSSGGSIS